MRVIYQADGRSAETLKSVRDHLQDLCRRHINHYVRVETMDGHAITGRIAGCDRGILYLAVPGSGMTRTAWGSPYPYPYPQPGYYDVILPLVLYELLVISLLYT
jgi:hypothetical protein